MLKFKEPPAGYLLYFVTIAVNFLGLILRVSAHEMQFTTTSTSALATHSTMNMNITSTASSLTTPAGEAAAAAAAAASSAQYTMEPSVSINGQRSKFAVIERFPMNVEDIEMQDENDATRNNITDIKTANIFGTATQDNHLSTKEAETVEMAGGGSHGAILSDGITSKIDSVSNSFDGGGDGGGNAIKLGEMLEASVAVQPTMRTKNGHTQLLRNHLSSRIAIKSSSASLLASLPSAVAAAAGNKNVTIQKGHKTDAPMLNYIFDSHLATNKHHHYDRYGPHFDTGGTKTQNVTAQVGSEAYLDCRIRLLQDKTVSWVKRETNDEHLQLLTVGTHTYSGDARFSVDFQYPNNWRLRIADANKTDEGLYECQISTHPPRFIQTNFRVQTPEVIIVDEHENPLIDKYYEVDSTIEMVCIVRYASMATSAVYWLHGQRVLNFDMTRGGVSVKTNLLENGANSTLFIAKVRKSDTGNYTCSIGPNDFYTINVHVINGESLAELYHGSAHPSYLIPRWCLMIDLLLVAGLMYLQSALMVYLPRTDC